MDAMYRTKNIEQLQNPTIEVTINNGTSTLERTAVKATGGLNAFYGTKMTGMQVQVDY